MTTRYTFKYKESDFVKREGLDDFHFELDGLSRTISFEDLRRLLFPKEYMSSVYEARDALKRVRSL